MSNKKEVLILIDFFLPGTKNGGPVKSINNLIIILKSLFKVTIFTNAIDKREPEVYLKIKTNKGYKKNGAIVFYFSKVRDLIKSLIQSKNKIWYANSFFSLKYGILPIIICKLLRKEIIVAPRGELTAGALSIKKFKKNFYLILFKYLINNEGIVFHFTSEQEKNDFTKLYFYLYRSISAYIR